MTKILLFNVPHVEAEWKFLQLFSAQKRLFLIRHL